MTNLENVTSCCNQIKILIANIFRQAHTLETVDLKLSGLNKTDKFWLYRKTNVNSEDSVINWNDPPGLRLILNGIRLVDNDYCLTKPIDHILNKTTLVFNIDQPCNCFILKFKYSFDSEQRSSCLLNDSVMNELRQRCEHINSFYELLLNGTTTSSFTEWISSLPIDSSTSISTTFTLASITSINVETSKTTVSTMLTSSITVAWSSNTIEESSISSVINLTMAITQVSSKQPNTNQQKKIILATTILSVFVIIVCSIIIHVFKRRQTHTLDENIEMHQKILFNIDEK
ncbi:unnamed protein product [Rotaria sp. Silwood2]|nr:unnamed protein product [Rotaria sp. Silwood2]CAF2893235.1 unnamed protein product [Rotaria sp. Silwood2]CAF3190845.1 unnamed protein product [Rotaria sp. Silwood2]CAF3369443.1 unnamed protein product [Rotaria sp. Silwood2]CAF3989907.1 unnamed protein product [Rotaria sp. Silwood2]